MYWSDILLLMLSATLANHLGLVEAVEGVLRHKIPVLNCSKCASFWVVLLCSLLSGQGPIVSVAVSFLCAWAAVWLELLCGYIDTLYNKLYESIYPKETDDKASTKD
ncbi:MAG: hypothetical protein K6F72_00175 [Bacteroidales bacterium]|nr:hypothetical protein [Bacteroidales bacterium]